MSEDREPSEAIVAFLRVRLSAGRAFSTTRDISEGTGLSRKTVGIRMATLAKTDWHGLSVQLWSKTVWLVKEGIKHGQRDVRETV